MTVLLANVILITQIRYGDSVITHNTTRPYIFSLFLLLVSLFEVTLYLLINNIFFANDWGNFFRYLSRNLLWQSPFLVVLNAKYALVLLNMMARIYDHMTLQFFLIYQQNHTLQSLDLARD